MSKNSIHSSISLVSIIAILIIVAFSTANSVFAQNHTVFIDSDGIMRWNKNKEEITGFGVNYTLPFAHAYRTGKNMNVDIYEEIDKDVYHFSRLGFDLYRVHVWDTEISDSLGNLVENEHLKAFDYLLYKLQQRKINYIITPIAFWGNGWPEKDRDTPGFSNKYGKNDCLTNPEAILAQENYLFQFMNHVNSYTGLSIKNDPHLIAVEISNEPHHRGETQKVRKFVEKMVLAVKRTGFKNPVMYNFSHGINYVEDYIAGGAMGGTFQWYPTGLGYKRELPGNYLPNVDRYDIPFDSLLKEKGIARTVYEFDAADIGKSYIYPAMARSFRTAGIQLATHFSYDPSFMAHSNTEYNTHYMNLAYTPGKALALMICAEVFREVKLYENFGEYPENQTFQNFFIDPAQDLALYNSPNSFIYTNSTKILPVNPKYVNKIAGKGNSFFVKYTGTGAYFLDKLDEGIWRLEVMPDVLITSDPFGQNSTKRQLSSIQWNERTMQIDLCDLGQDFNIKGMNEGNQYDKYIDSNSFSIYPGTYLIYVDDIELNSYPPESDFNQGQIGEFAAAKSNVNNIAVVQYLPDALIAEQPFKMEVEIISPEIIESVDLFLRNGFKNVQIPLDKKAGFKFQADIPLSMLREGFLNMNLSIQTKNKTITYPGPVIGSPGDWDFDYTKTYEIPVIGRDKAVSIFEASKDHQLLRFSYWPDHFNLIPQNSSGSAILEIGVDLLHKSDPENPDGQIIHDFTIRHFPGKKIKDKSAIFDLNSELLVHIGSIDQKELSVQIALVDSDGVSFGTTIKVKDHTKPIRIPFSSLKIVPTVLMPRPYPTFLPYFFSHHMNHGFDLSKIEGIQISIGPGLEEQEFNSLKGLIIQSISLE